jgi:hypothetical protein
MKILYKVTLFDRDGWITTIKKTDDCSLARNWVNQAEGAIIQRRYKE